MPRGKKGRGAGLAYRRRHRYRPASDAFEGCPGTYKSLDQETVQSFNSESKGVEDGEILSSTCDFSMQTDTFTSTCDFSMQTLHGEGDGDHMYAQYLEESSEVGKSITEPGLIEHIQLNSGYMDSSANIDVGFSEVTVESVSFQSFSEDVKKSVLDRNYVFRESVTDIKLLKLYEHENTSVKLTVKIDSEFICSVSVHRQPLDKSHNVFSGLPSVFDNVSSVMNLLDRLDLMTVCCGNLEEEYHDLVPVGAGLSNNFEPGIIAYREGDFGAISSKGVVYNSTIRSTKCPLLTDRNVKCVHCVKYGYALQKRQKRMDERIKSCRTFNHTKFKHTDMTRNELCNKLREQKTEINSLQHQVWKLQRQYEQSIKVEGVKVQDHENRELSDLMATCSGEFNQSFPDSSCRQRLFWEQQQKFCRTRDSRGMCWHPMIIRWCLFIRHKSEKAYEAIKDTGFIKLPSARTLYDYSHFLKRSLGLQDDVFKLAASECEKKGLYNETWRKNVGLLFDEIKIKEDLVYDKHSGELVGYCNLGDIGNQMLEFESKTTSKKQELAKFVLVVMLRSVCSSLCFPLCAFATKSITSEFLYLMMWEIVGVVELQLKLRVLFFTCDGATPNRRFFNMHRVGNEEVVYRTQNTFNDESGYTYFISDVPHLVKTLRNNLSNSHSHNRTRYLWRNGKDLSWLHIVRFFEEHCELNLYNPCPKLTRKHVTLAAFNYMKVNLAAQVLSDSVANALEDFYGPETSETVNFLRMFNKFFDCLNVRSMWEGRNTRKANLCPYTSAEDARLTFLTEEINNYLNDWNQQVTERPGNFSKAQRASMLLSHQTVTGVKMSSKSISECVRILLNQGAKYVLTHCFNQDPLEQHFGHYRHKSGANNNPSVYEVQNTLTTLRAVNSQALPPKRGNVRRGVVDIDSVDNSKLPRRK